MPSPPPDELPDGYALAELYEKRVQQNMDLFIIVSDWHNRRGTGKTIASLRLAHTLDRTEAGITPEKATLSVEEITQAYTDQPKGSALLLDEAEAGVSKYEAGTATNKAMRRLVSMGRIEQKYVIMNLPNSGSMDRDLKALADVWIIVTARGAAKCNILGYNPWGDHPTVAADHLYSWDSIPKDHQLNEVYNHLNREKRRRLRGEGENGDRYLQKSEAEDIADRAAEEARRQTRDNMLQKLYRNVDGLTQKQLADSAGLSRSHVGDIVSEASAD